MDHISWNALAQTNFDETTRQLLAKCHLFVLELDNAQPSTYSVNTIKALKKKFITRANLIHSLNLGSLFQNELQALRQTLETMECILDETKVETKNKRAHQEICQLTHQIENWQAQALAPFIKEVFEPFHVQYSSYRKHITQTTTLINQAKILKQFLMDFINDFHQKIATKYANTPGKIQKKFDKYFTGIAHLHYGKPVMYPLHRSATSPQHFLALINALLQDIVHPLKPQKSKLSFLTRQLPSLLSRADLNKHSYYLKSPQLSFIKSLPALPDQPPPDPFTLKQEKHLQIKTIHDQLLKFTQSYNDIVLNSNLQVHIKAFKKQLADTQKAIDNYYQPPFAIRRVSSVFSDIAVNHHDRLYAHYFDKIDYIINLEKYWLFFPSSEKTENDFFSKNLTYPVILKPLQALCQNTQKQIALLEPADNEQLMADKIIKQKARGLTLLKDEVVKLKKCLFSQAYCNYSSLKSRQFILQLSQFLSQPIKTMPETTNPIDELFDNLFDVPLKLTQLAQEAECYTADETLALRRIID